MSLLNSDDLEAIAREALRRQDMHGVVSALRVMARRDPVRAERLLSAFQLAMDCEHHWYWREFAKAWQCDFCNALSEDPVNGTIKSRPA